MKYKKIALVCGASFKSAPYLSYYTDFFSKEQIPFDLIFWNRNSDDYSKLPDNYIIYNKPSSLYKNQILKLFDVFSFVKFAKKQIKANNYSGIIVFGIITPLLLVGGLSKKKTPYIIDVRDYSSFLKNIIIERWFKKIIEGSQSTYISSQGFRCWLPVCNKYSVFHNCAFDYFDNYSTVSTKFRHPIKILTIGQIRDYRPNTMLLSALANNNNFYCVFSGKGSQSLNIEEYAKNNKINNFIYTGAYEKEDEGAIAESSDIINSVFLHDVNSDSLLTNRLYLAIKHRKPLIVSNGCFQAEIVRKYDLGVVIDMDGDICKQLSSYCLHFNANEFSKGCSEFIRDVKFDMDNIQRSLNSFCRSCLD